MPKDCNRPFFSTCRVTAFCLTSLLLSGGVFALPTGGQVTHGSGQISQHDKDMIVDQNSQNMVINWNTFNIGNGENVNFHQPNSSAIALNRVTTQNASQILGNLNANGQVFIINPNGVIFGKNAQVRVGGLVASTRDISDKDFLSKNYTFSGVSTAGIVNNGEIDVNNGGYVALLGASVTNNGTVKAQNGNVSMAAGKQITLQLNNDSLLGLTVDQGELKAAVQNHGLIQANDGKIYLTAKAADDLTSAVVNNDGEMDANSLNADGGVIRLIADGGTATTSGKISATGVHGGTVHVLSDYHAGVMGGSIDVSGKNGGGSIRVGGGEHGNEKNIQNADVSYIDKNATLKADATDNGNGGSVVVWGNDGNNFFGHISARGGKNGGNGGSVETSSHNGLNVAGFVDTSAVHGIGGGWLLDPWNVTISAAGADSYTTNPFSATAESDINAASIDTALNAGGDVTIFTGSTGSQSGNITIDATGNLEKTTGAASTLYLKAAGSITDDGTIQATGSTLNLNFWANYAGDASDTSYTAGSCTTCNVTLNEGITINAGIFDIRAGGNIDLGAFAAVAMGSTGTISMTTNGGNITEDTAASLTAGTLSGSASGSVSLNGTGNNITTLGNFSAAGFALKNSNALTVSGIVGNTSTATTIETTGSNDLTLASGSNVRGNTITLTSGGAISQVAGGILTGTTLTGSAVGSAAFNGTANSISTLNGFTANGFTLKNSQALGISGVVGNIAADTTIQTTSGDITLNATANVKGKNITIASGRHFINSATLGGSVFTLGSGRWLVYSKNPNGNTFGTNGNTFGKLPRDNEQYGITYPTAPGFDGNGFLYSDPFSIPELNGIKSVLGGLVSSGVNTTDLADISGIVTAFLNKCPD